MGNRKKLTSRIASVLLSMAMVVTSIQLSAFQVSAAEGDENANPEERAVSQQELNEAFVVKNGTFAYGMDGWDTFAMIWEGYGTDASFDRVEEGIRVDVKNTGEAGQYAGPWTVALNQFVSVLYGKTYTVSFDVVSTMDRTIHSGFQEGHQGDNGFENGDFALIQPTELKAGEKQHVEFDIAIPVRDMSGNFVIQMGAEEPGTGWEGEHSITLSNIRMEQKGAREKYIVLTDPDFTDTDRFDLTGAAVELSEGGAGNYLHFNAGGSITYKGIQLEEGVNYAGTYAARTPFTAGKNAKIKAEITYADGTKQEVKTEETQTYTVRYRENFTALKSGEATLTLTADSEVLLDNFGVWVAGVADALGAVFPRANIMGLSFGLETTKVVLGEDVVVNASSASGLGIPEDRPMVVKVDGAEIASDKYSFKTVSVGTDKFQSTLTIDQSVFTEPDHYAVSLEVGGYESADPVFVTILPADGNLIENGNFENGFSGWSTWFNERYSGNANMTNDYKVAINMEFFLNWYTEWGDQGPVDWSTQLQTSKSIQVEKGKTYKLSFKASSTVKRPIAVTLTDMNMPKRYMLLDTEEQTYTETFTASTTGLVQLTFLMGQFTEADYKDYPYTATEFEKHTMYFTDVSLVDASRTDEYKKMPSIIGVNEGKTYKAPVSAKVNYRDNDYTVVLTRNGQTVPYTEGTEIKENGDYVLTVTDKDDATITATKRFTIDISLDYDSKEYLVIANKSTEKVIEAGGTKAGRPVIQSAYAGRASQFFALDVPDSVENPEASDYVIFRSMATDLVIDVENSSKDDGAQLILNEYSGSDSQLWKVDETVHQGFVKFENKASGLVINVNGASKTEGLPLNQSANTGNGDEGQQSTDGQRWDIIRTINVQEAIEGKHVDVSTPSAWQKNAVVTPIANELNPAGQITTEFYPLEGATSYDIYFDGEKTYTITKDQLDNAKSTDEFMMTEDGTIKLFHAAYSVEVAKHTFYIQANTGTKTDEIEIFLSKKGVGWATLHRVEDMNLSWYYHWATGEALGTDEKLTFVPMLWGNYGNEWQSDPANKKYGTVLSFNEPDWSDQSNVPVSIASAQAWVDRYNAANPDAKRERPTSVEEAWQSFMDSGLRIGSPATAIAAPYCNGSVTMNNIDGPDRWWYDFMDLMDANSDKGWDYDFVAIHSYDAGCSAKGFLQMIDDTYALTGKPIWITEFGVAEWNDNKVWKGGNPQTQQRVIEFMTEVINGLEERDYVEHYAWFPFDPNDDYGGASGIFDYETGELNALGQVYAQLGVPEGYEIKQYETEVPKIANIEATQTTLKVGEIANVTVGKGEAVSWTSTNPDAITVDENGNVEAIGEGNATIRVETADGSVGSRDFTVKNPELSSVTIRTTDGSKFDQLLIGEEKTLTFDTVPNKDFSASAATWKSSNASVVRIDNNRKITASKPGVSLITATVAGTTGYAIVTVYEGDELPSEKAEIAKPDDIMVRGETMDLTATITPAGTDYTWKSYTEKIATVDQNGKVTANTVGMALISVCVNDVPIATTAITVTAKRQAAETPVSKVTIKPFESSIMYVGDSKALDVTVEPENATNKTLTYRSGSPDIATVDENGTITAHKAGNVIIRAEAANGPYDMIMLTILNEGEIPVSKLTLNKDRTSMYVGDNMTLSATLEPANATNKTVTYISSAPDLATVDENGKITALKEGTVVITAASGDGLDTISITITKKPAVTTQATLSPINVASTTILIGQTVTASTTVSPAGTAITWSSSNEAAARVDSKGVITGVAAGQATITATAGSAKVSVVIQVNKPTVKWNVTYKTCPLQFKKSTTALKAIGLQPGDKIVSYKSSNTKIATVSKTGKIKAKKKKGSTKITVTTQYGATATITIKTQKAPVKVTKLTVNKTKLTMKKGESFQLAVTKKYITSLYKVKYTSSNKKVATVSKKGMIKAKKKGKATIVIKCKNKTKKVKVTVK